MVVFSGVSGSGKSSLAFGTLYAEAQRRYFESVAPYARRLIQQVAAPKVDEITGLPPAVALQQRRGTPSSRSTVGTLTTLSNLLRLLYSRAGTYPRGAGHLEAEAFSPNTAAGACPECHGLGRVHRATEQTLVPDPSLTIREGAIAAWPGGWQGRNLRDIVTALGIDVDIPWRRLSKRRREWLLFTQEQPVVLVTPEEDRDEWEYNGTFWGAERWIMRTIASSKSQAMRDRAMRFVVTVGCPECDGSGLRRGALRVRFASRTIAEVNALSLVEVAGLLAPTAALSARPEGWEAAGERSEAAARLARDLVDRIGVLLELGLGYLSLGRATTTLSPGEMQRLRIATQLRSGLFGVVYVLDEPSAGLHPADAEPLLAVLERLQAAGNSLFVVEHDMDVVRRADWVVDVGPAAGEHGGRVLYSGPVDGLAEVDASVTRRFLFGERVVVEHAPREPTGWIELRRITRHNLRGIDVTIPLGVLTAVTGVSGSGKSTLVTHVLSDVVRHHLGAPDDSDEQDVYVETETTDVEAIGLNEVDRLVRVDQRPIGRTPRSNLATYTGLFDAVRKAFAGTPLARRRRYTAGRFSFNVAAGRCDTCQGDGFVEIELIFLPGTYAPCPTCHGARYNAATLQVTYQGRSIAEVLDLTVDDAAEFFVDLPGAARSLATLREVGLGYLRLGQPATELSGGEAQRIKLATELQRAARGRVLYVLDEPTSGLHPADVQVLLRQLHRLVDAGHSVVVVEHDLDVIASADWVIDLGPGGGDQGGTVVVAGPPSAVARTRASATGRYLKARLD